MNNKLKDIIDILGDDIDDIFMEGINGDSLVSVTSGEPLFEEFIQFQKLKTEAILAGDDLELGRLCRKAALTYAEEVASDRSEEFRRFLAEERTDI